MEKKSVLIELPEEVSQALNIKNGQPVQAILKDHQLLIKGQSVKTTSSTKSWYWNVINILVGLGFLAYQFSLKGNQANLTGENSIATYIILVGVLVGFLTFVGNFYRNRQLFLDGLPNKLFWRVFLPISLAFAVVLALILIGFFWLMGLLFRGATFDAFTAMIIVTVLSFAVTNGMSRVAESLRASWLTSLFTVIIISGVVIAMATNSSRQWWQVNLSFLGTQKANASWQFNLTLMLAALILFVLVDYLFSALKERLGDSRRLLILRGLLSALAIDLGAVGYFPNDAAYHKIHTDVAGYLVYIIIALIVGIKWLMPKVSRDFLITSYSIGLFLIVLEILYQGISYLSLTAFEMSAFILAFTWLVLLIGQLEALIAVDESIELQVI